MSTVKVHLSGKYVNKFVLLDYDDFEKLKNHKIFYSSKGYAQVYLNGKNILLHRLIMNTPSGLHTDHINRDKLDNRKGNLRVCTHSVNAQNQPGTGKSTYKGVSRNGKFWQANIYKDGIRYYLGNYLHIEDAVAAYNKRAVELYGELAYTNKCV